MPYEKWLPTVGIYPYSMYVVIGKVKAAERKMEWMERKTSKQREGRQTGRKTKKTDRMTSK